MSGLKKLRNCDIWWRYWKNIFRGTRTLSFRTFRTEPMRWLVRSRGRGLFWLGLGGGPLLAIGLLKSAPVEEEIDSKLEEQRKLYAVMKKADELYDNYLIDHVYSGLKRYANSDQPEILWRLARATCERAKLSISKEEKKQLFFEAFQHIQRALDTQSEPGLFAVHKWYAIILNYKTEYDGVKEQLRRSMEVKEQLERALALSESDPTTWHILALWHFTFADMPSYQRYLASLIFARPPQSDYKTALDIFLKAESIQQNFYSKNSLMIGKTLARMGEKEAAIPYLESAAKRVVVSADDYEAHKEAIQLLKRMGAYRMDQ